MAYIVVQPVPAKLGDHVQSQTYLSFGRFTNKETAELFADYYDLEVQKEPPASDITPEEMRNRLDLEVQYSIDWEHRRKADMFKFLKDKQDLTEDEQQLLTKLRKSVGEKKFDFGRKHEELVTALLES